MGPKDSVIQLLLKLRFQTGQCFSLTGCDSFLNKLHVKITKSHQGIMLQTKKWSRTVTRYYVEFVFMNFSSQDLTVTSVNTIFTMCTIITVKNKG